MISLEGTSAALIATGVSVNLATSFMNNSGSPSVFSLVNVVQLLMLLPLIGVYLPVNVLSYIVSMNFSMFNFDYVSIMKWDFIKTNTEEINPEQENDYLGEIGLESENSAVNITTLLGFTALLPILHLVVAIIYKSLKRKFDDK